MISIVDRIAQEQQDAAVIARMEDEDARRYGTTARATIRSIQEYEARLYRDEGLLEVCIGCKQEHSIELLTGCEDCGHQVCATCPATCPHGEAQR